MHSTTRLEHSIGNFSLTSTLRSLSVTRSLYPSSQQLLDDVMETAEQEMRRCVLPELVSKYGKNPIRTDQPPQRFTIIDLRAFDIKAEFDVCFRPRLVGIDGSVVHQLLKDHVALNAFADLSAAMYAVGGPDPSSLLESMLGANNADEAGLPRLIIVRVPLGTDAPIGGSIDELFGSRPLH